MSHDDGAKRIDRLEIVDAPFPWNEKCAGNHDAGAYEAEKEGKFEALEKSRYFDKERRVLDFLGCGAPGHINPKEMADQSL